MGKNCSVLWRKYTGIGLTAVVDWEARNVAVNLTHDIRLETIEARLEATFILEHRGSSVGARGEMGA